MSELLNELVIDRPRRSRATLLLAHGAGAAMDSPFMSALAQGLCTRGITVARFEFPYMAERRKTGKRAPPNRMPVLEACFREALAALGKPRRLFCGGKSMGGRVATMLADSLPVRGVIALGYPFHPPNRPDKLRVEHLSVLSTPSLIVQGSRDTLGSRAEVATYRLSASTEVHWIEDGDHSLEPRKVSGRTTAQSWNEAADVVARFIDAH